MGVDTLEMIEAALAEGFENCGETADCVFAEPLRRVRRALRGVRT